MPLLLILVAGLFAGCAVKSVETVGVVYQTPGVPLPTPPGQLPTPTVPVTTVEVSTTTPVIEPVGWPLSLSMAKAKIVSSFGSRKIEEISETHEGVDIAAPVGTSVRSVREGKVIFAGFSKLYCSRKNKEDKYQLIILLHPDGKSSRYVHLTNLKVKPGQTIPAGQVLGVLAASDEVMTPVLHFEMRGKDGKPQDPKPYLNVGAPSL